MAVHIAHVYSSVDETITRTVRALMGAENVTLNELSAGTGIPVYTISRRMKQSQWLAGEVSTIADYFGRSPGDLFTGDVGNVRKRARRDSNPEPSDPKDRPQTFRRPTLTLVRTASG